MPSVRASCCPLPLATPSGECVNHHSSVTLLCLNYKWGLFGIIKQICHASGGNMMECLPSGGWFSLGLHPRENHPPSGKHSIMLPPLAWHICIISLILTFSEVTQKRFRCPDVLFLRVRVSKGCPDTGWLKPWVQVYLVEIHSNILHLKAIIASNKLRNR